MTYIEFFDRDSIENICACLTESPERVILIGHKKDLMDKYAQRYREVFSRRGCDTEFECKCVGRNNPEVIAEVLCELIDTYKDCAFGLTGGEETYLLALGMVLERRKNENIEIHRFNVAKNTITDIDKNGKTVFKGKPPVLSVEENIRIYGGDIINEDERPDGTRDWDMNEEFCEDIDTMWEICKSDTKKWNCQISILSQAEETAKNPKDSLILEASVPDVKDDMRKNDNKYEDYVSVLRDLYKKGLIISYEFNDERIRIVYKNEQVKAALTKAGQALELKVYKEALFLKDEEGAYVFNDVLNGVCIDWDGDIGPESKSDTENEIDVMMMRGMLPVFLSCKNGRVEMEELYKLNTVASRFGGKNAVKALVASSLDKESTFGKAFIQRAHDMGIEPITGSDALNDTRLRKKLEALVN